jgi:hypothetical protein
MMSSMAASPYLAQALQSLSATQSPQPTPQLTPEQMAQFAQKAQAYQQANPGGNYLGHNLMQAGRNIMGLPGQVGGGLANLAQSFGIGAPQSAPY